MSILEVLILAVVASPPPRTRWSPPRHLPPPLRRLRRVAARSYVAMLVLLLVGASCRRDSAVAVLARSLLRSDRALVHRERPNLLPPVAGDHAGETKRRSRAGLTGNPLIQARIQIVFVRFDNERSIPPTHLSDSSPLSLGYTAFPCSSQLSDSIAQIEYLTSELEIRR